MAVDGPITLPPNNHLSWLIFQGGIPLAQRLASRILGFEALLGPPPRLATFCCCRQDPCSTKGGSMSSPIGGSLCGARGPACETRGTDVALDGPVSKHDLLLRSPVFQGPV